MSFRRLHDRPTGSRGTASKLISEKIGLIVALLGVVLIAGSMTFHLVFLKVRIDSLLAEVGSLMLVLGFLHFMYELQLRDEMFREISTFVLENQRLYDLGLCDCLADSKTVKETDHWEATTHLTVGLQYSARPIEDMLPTIARRAAARRRTEILIMDEKSAAATYLKESKTGFAHVEEAVARILDLVGEFDPKYVSIKKHDRVLRYSFIRTDESIWVKFYTNANFRTPVPALKVRAKTQLYDFFSADIDRLGDKQ
jgi:hypothetical protein